MTVSSRCFPSASYRLRAATETSIAFPIQASNIGYPKFYAERKMNLIQFVEPRNIAISFHFSVFSASVLHFRRNSHIVSIVYLSSPYKIYS